ncbi:Superoxide dismutase [Mn] 1, mitochondrial, partial [Fragariocoptes setiger]
MVLHSNFSCLTSVRAKHSLPDLPYDYNALEPTISAEIMKLHHGKHHAAYVNNLNIAEEKLSEAMQKNNVSQIIELQKAIVFNGGGHVNHSIFWKNLSPSGGGDPSGALLNAINSSFASVDDMRQRVSSTAVALQGAGWAWLAYCPQTKKLTVRGMPNQDPLHPLTGLVPLFGIDVWEHAYYLQYKNARPDYVKAIWNIVNWKDVEERFIQAQAV